jgi:hypothetical protein
MQAPGNFESHLKLATIRIFLIFLMPLFTISCSYDMFAPDSEVAELTPQAKEILINNGRYDKPFETLGSVEYSLKTSASTPVNQQELRNQAVAFLKQTALAKYSEKVDAIVDVKVVESTEENYTGKLSIIDVSGIAVAFIPEATPATKQKIKSKAKPSKNLAHKPKIKSEEIEITPSEILK